MCADGEYPSLLGASHLHVSISRQQQQQRGSAVIKNICHCRDNFSEGEGDGHSSNILVGLDC